MRVLPFCFAFRNEIEEALHTMLPPLSCGFDSEGIVVFMQQTFDALDQKEEILLRWFSCGGGGFSVFVR